MKIQNCTQDPNRRTNMVYYEHSMSRKYRNCTVLPIYTYCGTVIVTKSNRQTSDCHSEVCKAVYASSAFDVWAFYIFLSETLINLISWSGDLLVSNVVAILQYITVYIYQCCGSGPFFWIRIQIRM